LRQDQVHSKGELPNHKTTSLPVVFYVNYLRTPGAKAFHSINPVVQVVLHVGRQPIAECYKGSGHHSLKNS